VMGVMGVTASDGLQSWSEGALRRARAGDENAFRELVDPFRGELHLHWLPNPRSLDDAGESVQETLLAAWRGLAGFEERASLRAWLYRIATNRCLNALRDRKRRPRRYCRWPSRRSQPVWPSRCGSTPTLMCCSRGSAIPRLAGVSLRDARVSGARIHGRAATPAAPPARSACAARGPRLSHLRSRRDARDYRSFGQGRAATRPRDARRARTRGRSRARTAAGIDERARARRVVRHRGRAGRHQGAHLSAHRRRLADNAAATLRVPGAGGGRRVSSTSAANSTANSGSCPLAPTASPPSAATCQTLRRRSRAPTV